MKVCANLMSECVTGRHGGDREGVSQPRGLAGRVAHSVSGENPLTRPGKVSFVKNECRKGVGSGICGCVSECCCLVSQRLQQLSRLNAGPQLVAKIPLNINRNRYRDVLPSETLSVCVLY